MDIYKRILFREPNPLEKGAAFGWFEGREPARAVQDLIWTLFNHPDFTHR